MSGVRRALAHLQQLFGPSLFRRMWLAQILVILSAFCVLLIAQLLSYYVPEHGVIDEDLKLLAEATARTAALNPTPSGAQKAAEAIEEMNRARSDPPLTQPEYVWRVWSRDGQLLCRSQEFPPLGDILPKSISHQRRTEQEGWFLIAADSPDGEITAIAGYTEDMLRRAILRDLWRAVPTVLVIHLVLFCALWLASYFGLKPLVRLRSSVLEASETLSDLPQPSHRELRPFVAALNSLIASQRQQRETEKAFFADAAHELRTPLAVINAQAHVLATVREDEDRLAALRDLESGVGRSSDVLEKLLTLARLDTRNGFASPEKHPIPALVRNVIETQALRALHSGHELALYGGEDEVLAFAVPAALEAALTNLIDNALRYTPPGTQIEITIEKKEDQVHIRVEDSGPGIAEDEKERVFERFERGIQSHGVEGSGLGLAIVKQAMLRCGAQVSLERSRRLGGACFCLALRTV